MSVEDPIGTESTLVSTSTKWQARCGCKPSCHGYASQLTEESALEQMARHGGKVTKIVVTNTVTRTLVARADES